MRLKIVLILGAIALLALVAAGCGGGGNSSSSSTTTAKETTPGSTASKENASSDGNANSKKKSEESPESKQLTKSEFTIRMNEACIQVPPTYKEHLKELEKGGKTPSKAEINLKAAVPPLYDTIGIMESLKPPPGEEQELEEVISALESAAKGLEAEPESELSGPNSPYAEFQKLTKEFGFETCAGL